ncbi:carboxymuconolactone decarboxylase family protein [Legionella sp.]|uniref:carboxymuconolactone decarboxylase family protein n=1 Tax=Legionella sp. TaxID=459 RepID=UPI003C9E224E
MRLNIIEPTNLTKEQKPLYKDMRNGIETNFQGFKAIFDNGSLIGPWNPWLHFPKIGGPIWELVKALSTSPTLPKPAREIAILVTGTKFHSGYELYAHVLMAEARGLDDLTIATIVAGQRPTTLGENESLVYDITSSLMSGGVLPKLLYQKSVQQFGQEGTAELIYLIGLYSMVSITLNGFDVPVPE